MGNSWGCPSKTKSIYAFPLLITLRSHDRRHITGYLAHPFLRGSIGFDPTTKRSHQDLYLACPGWGPGGGIVSSYAGAITLLDGYRRLTGTATTPITSIPHRDIPRATSLCRSAPTRTPPVLRQYILNQLASLGAPDITLWDRLSTNHPSFPPYELPIRDPVLTTVHSRGEGDARPTSHIHLEGGDTHPRSVSTTPLSISESTSTPSEPSSSQLTQDQKTRQSLINRVSTNKKLHAMPMAGSSTFQTFRNNLELDLRGSAWHPRGKWILDYQTTDLSDPLVTTVSDDLASLLAQCARSTGEACLGQLLGAEGRNLFRQSLGCELWHQRVLRLFQPDGICATWDNHDLFVKI